MDWGTALTGLVKLGVGFATASTGIVLAFILLRRWLKLSSGTENTAAAIVEAASVLALALLVKESLSATFDSFDLFVRRGDATLPVYKIVVASMAHIAMALGLGVVVLRSGIVIFNRLTPGIDELEEVRNGAIAPALVLGAIFIVLAMLTAPGLDSLLDSLIPFPPVASGLDLPPVKSP